MKRSGDDLGGVPGRPLFSIIVPSCNQGRFIRQTIQSCLDQDYRPIEILVIDGASTDETVEVLKSFGDIPELTWLSKPDSGVVDAVNKGFARAKGDIGLIHSSDDCFALSEYTAVVSVVSESSHINLVYTDCQVIG